MKNRWALTDSYRFGVEMNGRGEVMESDRLELHPIEPFLAAAMGFELFDGYVRDIHLLLLVLRHSSGSSQLHSHPRQRESNCCTDVWLRTPSHFLEVACRT